MSRSATRTPPIRINPSFLSSLAPLDPTSIASVIRIAAHQYEAGKPMTISEFGMQVGEDGLFLHAILQGLSHLLDPEALDNGLLVISEISKALEHRAELMSKRSEAAHLRYVRAAAEQKSQGNDIKLTRGRVAKRSRGATAVEKSDANNHPVCTHVHNTGKYAHVCADSTCTHVHNEASDAHVCITEESTHVHKKPLDAHVCIEEGDESDDYYAHVCIPSAEEDFETPENRGFVDLDRFDEPSHVRARPPRADLSISISSSKKNKRDESSRESFPENGSSQDKATFRANHKGPFPPKPVATKNLDGSTQFSIHEGRSSSTLPVSRPSAGSSRSEVPAEFVRRLLEAGPVDADNARRQLALWIEKWGEPFVQTALDAIPNKKIARPISYLSTILTNLAKEAAGTTPTEKKTAKPSEASKDVSRGDHGARLPRRVKRRVNMPPGASWERLGWTAKGHEGDRGTTRMQVWRTESGDLRYMDAPASETIPTYEEDPGVYAYD